MAEWILVKPAQQDESEARAFAEECHSAGNLPIQGGSGLGEMDFAEWLLQVDRYDRGENLPEGHVSSSCYLLKDGETPRIYGVISVRWRLSPALRNHAGNIGYSIRPSEQKKGLGSVQLGLALEKCRAAGMERALVTCVAKNRASAGVMLSQGGVEDHSYTAPDGTVFRRFWIPTTERVVLRRPLPCHQAAAEEMIAEFRAYGENMLYGSGGAGDSSYEKWLEKLHRYADVQSVPEGNVPQHIRFGVLLPQNRLIGYIALRPKLSEALRNIGGNIGYCIRPSERKKGYGHAQLGRALIWLREQGLERALVTCVEQNRASAGTALSHGGVEEAPFIDELDIPHRRFWIPTGERLVLKKPGPADEPAVQEMLQEFAQAGEDVICGSAGVNHLPYADWLRKLEKDARRECLAPDRMPRHTYLSVLMPTGRPLGFVAIRPELNEALLHAAGHIGYSVRPSERKRGYGSAQLAAALRNIGERGVEQALITCDQGNIASAATILSQGGVEDEPWVEANGDVQRRFWIRIEKK